MCSCCMPACIQQRLPTAIMQTAMQTDAAMQRHTQADVAGLERCVERIKAGVRDIDTRVGRVSQTATRIGDRLQTAEAMRVRCLEALELMSYLQAFSVLPSDADFGPLPRLFTDDATMAEAAVGFLEGGWRRLGWIGSLGALILCLRKRDLWP
jgi:hypothetical protein